jgi:DGQHR domain-containing protein
MTLTIPGAENQYSLRTPAHRFRQGPRDVYSFVLDLPTLDGLLPQRVDEDIVKDANRRLTPSHARNIQAYLADRPDWLLGSMLLGIAPDAVEFISGKNESGQDLGTFGELRIRTNRINTLRIFDGQHRRRAITDVLNELDSDHGESTQLDLLRNSSIPIVLYAEQDIKALRQMFADASKTKPIEANTVTRFDKRDAFNLAAVWVADNSDLFSERVEKERTTVQRSSPCLISINQLAKTLKTLEFGYKSRVSRDRNEDLMQDIDSLYERCLGWADEFLPSARSEFNDLLNGDLDNEEIPRLRPTTFAFNSTVIRVMAGCLFEWREKGLDESGLAKFFAEASMDRRSGTGNLLSDSGMVTANGTVLASNPIVMEAINYIVKRAQGLLP